MHKLHKVHNLCIINPLFQIMSIRTTKKRLLSISTMMEDHHKTLMTKVLAPQPSKTRVLAMESLDL